MTTIALTGLAQSCKDTTAEFLVDNFGFEQVSFAEPLKKISYDIDPVIAPRIAPEHLARHVSAHGWAAVIEELNNPYHLSELVDEYGYDYVKVNYPEARRFLQRIGTEGLRKNVDDDFWVNLALQKIEKGQETGSDRFVISDMRFYNEYDKCKTRFGDKLVVWRIFRDGLTAMNHASELELNDIPYDAAIYNNGTIEELHSQISSLWENLHSV